MTPQDPHRYVLLAEILFVLMCVGVAIIVATVLTNLVLEVLW